ncbi:hypothetical protein BASA83_001790 [Batrachochytrium salamandrivorans]|nr:hypothetical protein BASA83_001790 [Batrachochytrium salamandrivorans]
MLWSLAIKLDNRLFERRQEQRQQQKPASQYNSKSNVGPHFRYQQNYQQDKVFENRRDQVHTRQSGPALTTHYQDQMTPWILTLLIEDH